MPIIKSIRSPMPIAKSAVVEKTEVKEAKPAIVSFQEPEIDRGLYAMLEVYDKSASDPDIQEKVKYIQDSLGETPKDELMHIITELGITPLGDTKLNRVWKYLRLKQQSDKVLKHYENIKANMNSMRINQWA